MDSFVYVMLGVIKGIGKQALATVAYLICFYLISIPASYLFCFNLGLGLRGLWIGLSVGLVILILALSLIVRKADWFRVARVAKEKYLRESTFYRSSTALVPLEDSRRLSQSLGSNLDLMS